MEIERVYSAYGFALLFLGMIVFLLSSIGEDGDTTSIIPYSMMALGVLIMIIGGYVDDKNIKRKRNDKNNNHK